MSCIDVFPGLYSLLCAPPPLPVSLRPSEYNTDIGYRDYMVTFQVEAIVDALGARYLEQAVEVVVHAGVCRSSRADPLQVLQPRQRRPPGEQVLVLQPPPPP